MLRLAAFWFSAMEEGPGLEASMEDEAGLDALDVVRHAYHTMDRDDALHLLADRELIQSALLVSVAALQYAADVLLLDPTFAPAEKRQYYLLKLTMLSGRSTVVLAPHFGAMGDVLWDARRKLALPDAGSPMELWHGAVRVPHDAELLPYRWPGMQPKGEITEYQLLVRR
eukprot:6492772-Amphidinium_carterae.1